MVHCVVSCRQVYKSCTGNHASLVTIFDMLSEVKQLTSRSGRRLAPLFGVVQAVVILGLRPILVCKCGTGGILVCNSSELQSPSLASVWR